MVWKGDSRGRLAKSLITLVDQVDAMWPKRDRTSDGSIGDTRHQARQSDHNPNAARVVTALDLDRDITAGFDARALAETLVASRDPRIKYIISNGQIISSKVSPWVWRPYTGVNAHREHIHISVDADPALYDDARPWSITGAKQEARPGMFTNITATVFGGPSDSMSGTQTAYGNLIAPGWWNRPGVALPARIDTRPLPKVRVTHNGRSVIADVIDVGPWNTKDPYWLTGSRPQAESGRDLTGRMTNKAGIDLTPAAAAAIGLPGKGIVEWEFVDAVDGDVLDPLPKPDATQPATANLLPLLLLMLLTKENPMSNETTGGQGKPDLSTLLLTAVLRAALTGKPLDTNELMGELLRGLLGVQALPPPVSNPQPSTPAPESTAPQSTNDLLLKILLDAVVKQPATAETPKPNPQPTPIPVTPATPASDKAAISVGGLGFLGTLLTSVLGGPSVTGADGGTVAPAVALTSLVTAGLGALGGVSPVFGILGRLAQGFIGAWSARKQ